MKHSIKIKQILFVLIILFQVFNVAAQNNESFNKLLAAYYDDGLTFNPIGATQRGDNRFNDILPNNISVPFLKKIHNFNIKYQQKLKSFKRTNMNSFDRISYDIMALQISQALESEKFHTEYIPINQFRSLANELPSMGSGTGIQPFKTVKDYYNWLKRLTAFGDWADTAISNFNKGIAVGMVLPKALVVKMIPQLEAQTIADESKNIFYGPLKMMPSSFSDNEKKEITIAYKNTINNKVIPTYKKLADYIKTVYLPKAIATSGLFALPNGSEYYQYLVKVFTTTNNTPAEIYNIGLSEVTRITKEIETLKNSIGFKGDMTAFFNYALTDKQFFPYTTDEQVLDSFRAILPKIEPNLKKIFNIVPKAAFEVKAIDKFKAATSAANYQRGAEDGSRPGYFNVPIITASSYNKLGTENLFLHEAIPGHHFQLSVQQENTKTPKIRKFASYSVFSEGWALYTESLGEELGLYTDPYQKLAALKSELFRSIRLVTDVGLHTGKMTREESIKYMMEKGGRAEQGSISETERYMANPGQALSYKIGELKIKELKTKYQRELGPKFNIKNFHDALLLVGSVPLNILETYMAEWEIEQRK